MALTYHEARNVRHLIKAGHLEAEPYKRVRSLPSNRVEAWRELQPLRRSAIVSGNLDESLALFEKKFGLSLTDLARLYQDRHWKDAAFGGNKWAAIADALSAARNALLSEEIATAEKLLTDIGMMQHNTGYVQEKLVGLDKSLAP